MKDFKRSILLMLIALLLPVMSFASNAVPGTEVTEVPEVIPVTENESNSHSDDPNLEDTMDQQQQLIEDIQSQPGVTTVEPNNMSQTETNRQEGAPQRGDFYKDPIKEYQRVEIQKEKNLSILELLEGAEHPDIVPSTPQAAGFDPEDDREFFHFKTKLGNTYYLIKDDYGGKQTLLLATHATESDLLSLLSDAVTTDEVLEEEAMKKQQEEENRQRIEEERRLQEERERIEREKENPPEKEKENPLGKLLPIFIVAAVLIPIAVAVLRRTSRKKNDPIEQYEYDEDMNEEDNRE